jgi:arylsulfatase A-like enzyme
MSGKLLFTSILVLVFQFTALNQVTYNAESLRKSKKEFLNATKGKNSVDKPLNVVYIIADDLGKHDLSIYGNPWIQTPNIDRLAKEGVMFTDGYVTASVCSPSRAGLITGRYQQRFGYHLQPHQRYAKNKMEWWFFRNLINTSYMTPTDYQRSPDKNEVQTFGLPQSEIALSELFKSAGYATAWIGKWHLGYHEGYLPQRLRI